MPFSKYHFFPKIEAIFKKCTEAHILSLLGNENLQKLVVWKPGEMFNTIVFKTSIITKDWAVYHILLNMVISMQVPF